ncbi:MAG: ATP-binding protein [Acidobacteriota bacterium]
MRRLLRFFSRISFRLLAFNLLLVFLPAIGILSLQTYEQELLRYQERSMVQQGRLLAAALRGPAVLDPEDAVRILTAMDRQFDARLRVLTPDLDVVADSSRLGPRADDLSDEPEVRPEPEIRERPLYRLGNFLYRLYERFVLPPAPPQGEVGGSANGARESGPEIEQALAGGYGSTVRRTPGLRSLTLYSALPIRGVADDGRTPRVIGVVLVSRSTFQILSSLYELRLDTFEVVFASVLVAIVISLLLSTTIARPLHRLREQASALLDRRGRLTGSFESSRRLDEIGDLSRALAELTRRLSAHLDFTESFASDVSHELKNPLAAMRNAAELAAEVDDPHERARFLAMVQRDIVRLERLLNGVREVGRLDAGLERQPTEEVAIAPLLRNLVESYELRTGDRVHYDLATPAGETGDESGPTVEMSRHRLAQVLDNLLDNATSFSPEGGTVSIALTRHDDSIEVRVADEGPGIPEEHREKIFDRFFSYRPDGQKADHTGLGLAIARAIIEGYDGTLMAHNRTTGGAELVIRLPRA